MRRFWDEGMWSREVPGPGYHRPMFTPVSFAHAQMYCNFVVLKPGWVPEGCTVGSVSVRTEGERWSTVHFRILGPDRWLRVKEFLHDWTGLTDSAPNLRELGRPFTAQGTVGWHGVDYKGLQAACWSRWRTTVEISVEEGCFAPGEIEALCAAMEPADPAAAELVLAVPFARISYAVRRRRGPWGVDRVAGCTWSSDLHQAVEQAAMPVPVPRVLPPGFRVDSVGWRRSRRGAGGEVQVLVRHMGNGTDGICLRGTQPGSSDPVPIPPSPELRRTHNWSQLEMRQTTVWMGTQVGWAGGQLQPSPLGGWTVLWQEAGVSWECSARASQELTPAGLRQFIESLRMEQRSR